MLFRSVSAQTVARNNVDPLPLQELQQFAAVYGMIKSSYVESTDDKKLISNAIAGMVSGLDPHSQYYDKKAFKEFKEETSGKFVGVGIEISEEDGLIKIVSPIEDSPADKAGLKAGDLITRIDDKAVRGMTVTDAVKRMRGKADTQVVLTIWRKDESRTFTVTISSIQKQTAGALITVTYAAKVTEAGASGSKAVTNAVVLSDNGAEATDSTIITNSGFSFTKTDAQGNPLAGATFTIRVPGVDGSFTATSDKTGTVTFKGLADGTYEVNETTVPNGFQQSLKAKFNVIIENGEVKFRGTDVWGLAPKESSDKYQVKNVKNVSQLPLTGAAGTTLFTVVALLVAGAGVAVALKSRQRMR